MLNATFVLNQKPPTKKQKAKGAVKQNQHSYNNSVLESIGNSQAANPGQAESDFVF